MASWWQELLEGDSSGLTGIGSWEDQAVAESLLVSTQQSADRHDHEAIIQNGADENNCPNFRTAASSNQDGLIGQLQPHNWGQLSLVRGSAVETVDAQPKVLGQAVLSENNYSPPVAAVDDVTTNALASRSSTNNSGSIRYEVEDWTLSNYDVENWDFASNGASVRIRGDGSQRGTATTTFSNTTGYYNVVVGFFDETDGNSWARFELNGESLAGWRFDDSPGGDAPTADNLRELTLITNVLLTEGDQLTLIGNRMHGGEYARFDYIDFISTATTLNAFLDNDTGSSSTDNVTADPTIAGVFNSITDPTSLQVRVGDSGAYVDITNVLQADGSFALDLEQLSDLNGGNLHYGDYSVSLRAENAGGDVSEAVVDFTYELQIEETPYARSSFLPISLDSGSTTFNFGISPDFGTIAGENDQLLVYVYDSTSGHTLLNNGVHNTPVLSLMQDYTTYATDIVDVNDGTVSIDLSGLTAEQRESSILYIQYGTDTSPDAAPSNPIPIDVPSSSNQPSLEFTRGGDGSDPGNSGPSDPGTPPSNNGGPLADPDGGDDWLYLTKVRGDGFTVTYEQPDAKRYYTRPAKIEFGDYMITLDRGYYGDFLGSSDDDLLKLTDASLGPTSLGPTGPPIRNTTAFVDESMDNLSASINWWKHIGDVVFEPNQNLGELSEVERKKLFDFQTNLLSRWPKVNIAVNC